MRHIPQFTGEDEDFGSRRLCSIASAIGAAVGIGGALIGSSAAKSAAKTQARAADQATQLQRDIFQQNRADFAPFLKTGTDALGELSKIFLGTGLEPGEDRLSSFFESPGFQFRREEGEKGINRAAAARGLGGSGRVLKGLTEFNSNLASGEFNTFVNRLSDLAGIGSNTAAQGAASATQSGNQIGQSLLDAGTARASGAVGTANAFSKGLGDVGFSAQNFFNQGGGGNTLANTARADVSNPLLRGIF